MCNIVLTAVLCTHACEMYTLHTHCRLQWLHNLQHVHEGRRSGKYYNIMRLYTYYEFMYIMLLWAVDHPESIPRADVDDVRFSAENIYNDVLVSSRLNNNNNNTIHI